MVDPGRKISATMTMQEQMIETTVWKRLRRLGVETNRYKVCKDQRVTVHHTVGGCPVLAGTKYVRRHNNALMLLTVEWAKVEGLLSERTVWYKEKWHKGNVFEANGRKLYWDV